MVWQRFAKSPGESLCRFDSCRLHQRDFGFWIAEHPEATIQIQNPQSKIQNLKSKIRPGGGGRSRTCTGFRPAI